MALLPARAHAADPRRRMGWLWKPFFVLLIAALSWGCGMSPDDARVQLGKLGYEFTLASYLTAVDRNDVAAVEYFILAGMEPDVTLTKRTLIKMEDDEPMSEPLGRWGHRWYRPVLDSFSDKYNFTALMIAAVLGHTETVRVLLAAGADTDRRDGWNRTALIWAIRGGHLETAEVLRGADAEFEDEDVGPTLNRVAVNNDSVMLNFLLDLGVDSAVLNQAAVAAFIQAVEENAVDVASILIGTGVNVDTRGEDGDTPLIEAARRNRVEVVRMLLEAGADPNLQNDNGETALILAAKYGYAEVLQLLLDAGADLNATDGRGATPLASAIRDRNAPIVSALLKAGADPNEPDANGVTPFMAAFRSVSRRGNAEYLAMMTAMIEGGADADFQDEDGDSPLMQELTVSGVVEERFRFWLDRAAGTEAINHRNKDGSTALILAARWGHVNTVRDLIGAGADLDLQNDRGHTALMSAAEREERQTAAVLVEAGADPTLTTPDGKSAADLVPYYPIRARYSDPQIVSMLRAAASRWQAEGPKKQASPAPTATSNTQPPTSGVPGDLANETYLGGMKRRGMKVYALSKNGNWCSANVVFRIRAPSADVYTDGTAEFYLKRFGERINESQFCPAARSADIYGYTDAGSEAVFTGKASAATGWAMN